MKTTFTFLFFCFSFFSLNAIPLAPDSPAPLYEHLYEINKEWTKYRTHLPHNALVHFQNDQQRIQCHLSLVIKTLREHTPDGFSASALAARQQLLDGLQDYAELGQFPQNIGHAHRQPYFVDHLNTACAVGHLIRLSGNTALVDRIQKEANFAYIRELLHYSELHTWSKQHGFTTDELAWIQPGYWPISQTWYQVGNNGGVEGKVNVMLANPTDTWLYYAGSFSTIDGESCQNIAAWDGSVWNTLGDGLDGEIYDLDFDTNGRLYAAGEFTVPGSPEIKNLAYLENSEWHGFNSTAFDGPIYTIEVIESDLIYIGGDFIYDNSIAYLAKVNMETGSVQNQTSDFSVDGPVKDLLWYENQLYVAGFFSEVAAESSNPDNPPTATSGLGIWQLATPNVPGSWVNVFESTLSHVSCVTVQEDKIIVGNGRAVEEFSFDYSMCIFENDTIVSTVHDFILIDSADSLNHFRGFIEHDNRIIAYGNIFRANFDISMGIYLPIQPGGAFHEGTATNGTVDAAASFQGQLYLTGNFTSIGMEQFSINHMAYSPFDGIVVNTEEVSEEASLRLFNNGEQIQVEATAQTKDTEITIYNVQGQVIAQHLLPAYTENMVFPIPDWSSSIYFYQLSQNGRSIQSGKLGIYR